MPFSEIHDFPKSFCCVFQCENKCRKCDFARKKNEIKTRRARKKSESLKTFETSVIIGTNSLLALIRRRTSKLSVKDFPLLVARKSDESERKQKNVSFINNEREETKMRILLAFTAFSSDENVDINFQSFHQEFSESFSLLPNFRPLSSSRIVVFRLVVVYFLGYFSCDSENRVHVPSLIHSLSLTSHHRRHLIQSSRYVQS